MPTKRLPLSLITLGLAACTAFFSHNQPESYKNNPQTPDPRLEELLAEKRRLDEENAALRARLAEVQEQAQKKSGFKTFLEQVLKSHFKSILITLILLVLGIIPVWLVVNERWLGDKGLHDSMRDAWCKVDLLCRTYLPSYFLIIFICIPLLLVLFLFFARRHAAAFEPDVKYYGPVLALPSPAASQIKAAHTCQWIALAGLLAEVGISLALNRIPGIEFLAVILMFILGRLLAEIPASRFQTIWQNIPPWLVPFGLAQIALILLLQNLSRGGSFPWVYLLLTVAALANLLRYRRKTNPILWVFLLAQVLYSWKVGSWSYSIIGDEYNFFSYGRDILLNQNRQFIFSHFFNGQAVYGNHPYFSSLIQAASMWLLGVDNFGWRFSSIYLSAASILLFYGFLRTFLAERVAFVTALLLACSHYLINFGKIGYNNLQALFVMAFVLWLAARAIQTRRLMDYTFLGLAIGLCFYVYPAALYIVPLPFLLLLFFDPPKNRLGIQRWMLTLAGIGLLLVPLFFQPDYWVTKLTGTLFNQPEMLDPNNLIFHFVSNLIYAPLTYLYIPNETHFVVSSYIDPISGIFLPLGLALTMGMLRRNKFSRFALLAWVFLVIAAGVTHDRMTPSTTRMFILLPFLALFTTLGIFWLAEEMKSWSLSFSFVRKGVGILLILVLGVNLYQAYYVTRQRTTGNPNLEVLFLRLLQRNDAQNIDASTYYTYFFITQPNWIIDGIRELRDVYNLPDSQSQLKLEIITTPELSEDALATIRSENTFVIAQPWMESSLLVSVNQLLINLGKIPCAIQDAPTTTVVFTLWYSPGEEQVCPAGGVWSAEPGVFSTP